MWKAKTNSLIFLLVAIWVSGCDPNHKKKCEWHLVPELRHKQTVEPGWVSLCAKNYVTMKQKCFIQAKLGFSEKIYGRKFRYVDLELDEKSFPKKVSTIKFCDGK